MFLLKRVFVFLLFLGLLLPGICFAGISVEPSKQEVIMKHEETFKDYFTVYNDSQDTVTITVSNRDWFILPENRQKGLTSSSFLTASPTFFMLLPGAQGRLDYEIKIPTYTVGSNVSMVSFTMGSASGVSTRVSASVSVSAQDTEKLSWEILDLVLRPTPDTKVVTASLNIGNKGNVYVRPEGKLELTGPDGIKCVFNFDEDKPVYPGLDRALFANSEGCSLVPGEYKASVVLDSWSGYKAWHQTKKKKFKIKVSQDKSIEMIP